MDYKNKKWERKRKAILARDKYTCQYFKRYGKLKEENTVHHIFPVEFYAKKIGIIGVIRYNTFTHIDSREKRYYEINDNGKVTVL